MYKAILFDLDNTLLDYNSSELLSMKKTISEYGLMEKQNFLWDDFWVDFGAINIVYWNERVARNLNVHQVLEYSFRDTLIKMKEEHLISKSMALTYWELFCQSCHFEEGAVDLLTHLHGRYKLGIISNGIGEAQRNRLLKGEISGYFDTLVISDEVGHWKPDKAIFDNAMDKLGVRPNEVLFIGDSLALDYQGSLRAGLDFCFYNRDKQILDAQIQPKFTIEQLWQIKKYI